jgi:hypothetical protein
MVEASSTRMISWISWWGERSRTEWTVRRRTDQASLWKQMMTLVVGREAVERNRSSARHHGSLQGIILIYRIIIIIQLLTSEIV